MIIILQDFATQYIYFELVR